MITNFCILRAAPVAVQVKSEDRSGWYQHVPNTAIALPPVSCIYPCFLSPSTFYPHIRLPMPPYDSSFHELSARSFSSAMTPNATQRTTLLVAGCYILIIGILWYAPAIPSL